MKNLFLLSSVLLLAASCNFGNTYYEVTRTTIATFEYTGLDFDKTFGSDSLYFEEPYGWVDFAFFNKTDESKKNFTGGCALSMSMNPKMELNAKPQSAYGKTAYGLSKTFTLFYQGSDMPDHDISFQGYGIGTCTMTSCFVNNTAKVVSEILMDESPVKFSTGDWLRLTATGWYDGSKTGEASMYLADFREGQEYKDSVVTTWTLFDLSKLGSVQYVDFELNSSKENLSRYFCFDNMAASVYLKQ